MKKFNLLDVLIIIVIIAVALVGGKMLYDASGSSNAKQNSESAKVVYTIENSKATVEQVEAVKVGDRVGIGTNGFDSSIVTVVEYKPAEKIIFDSIAGQYKKVEIPEKYTLKITCEADATITDMAISAGNTPIRVGEEITLKGKGYIVIGNIVLSDIMEVAK